ncbi:MAG: TolC family protein [Bacteroidota bacterium]|jgi:outer membrane protein TolC|nr:TolC family protein [Ignavibacteria bacterium]MCU7498412.1 TolC family protein [Ignavibacteria bacterium]MCU7511954.1 TolC family protein [Ignavibacteria bacterium]MCU7520013.1 TolC family protein [Ignavibacteria bacterium]MCU7523088.1 TolC family protein [Ignavibacteria bacterium]
MVKKIKNVLLTLLLPLAALPQTASGQSLSLSDAVEISLRNNEKIKQYEEKFTQKRFQDLEAWGNFLPSVNFETSYNHLNDPMNIDLGPIRDVIMTLQSKNQTEMANIYKTLQGQPLNDQQKAGLYSQYYSQLNSVIPPFEETFKKQDFKTATLLAVQPLFTGGKLTAAKKFASEEKSSALIELEKVQNEVVQEAVNNYLSVILMNNIVKTRQNVLNGIRKHKDNAEKLFNEGLIANYNLLRAQVAEAEAERNLTDDENKLELARISLLNTMGQDESSNFTLSDTLVYNDAPASLENYLEQARSNQPILKLIELKKEAASDKYTAERANFLPTVAAFGKYEMLPQYLSSLEPRWAVGLQLKFNLFNGLKDYSKLQNAVHMEREVNYVEADAKRKIDLWVNKSFRDMINAKTRYEKLKTTLSLALENLRLNDKRFQSGMGTSLEVIDAQLSLEKNQVESLLSLYDYYKSLTDLYVVTGEPQKILSVWSKENKK